MTSTDVRIEVKNINPIIEEFVEKKLIKPDQVNRKTLWNMDEFSLFDPSGNRIIFPGGL